MKSVLLTIPLGLVVSHGAALAQEPPKPPKVLSIYREQVKPGRGGAHEKNETAWAQAFAKANAPSHYIAMTSVTGPSEAWFLEARDNFASLQANDEAIEANAALSAEIDAISARDGELLEASTHIVARYREELSYRADSAIPKMRYFSVRTVRVKPGHGNDFESASRLINDTHEKTNMDEHWAVYEVVSGAPDGTYLIFQPMESLSDLDALSELHGKEFRESVGEDNRDRLRNLTRDGVEYSRGQIFRFNPKMSNPTKEFIAGDPEFWTPKADAGKKKQ